MQVQKVNLTQNNYQQKHNPNFTAIKSVKCEGLYKKYPELANELVSAFKQNPKAMEFCKKYDVDIVFFAVKRMQESVESSIHIFFDNVSNSSAKKFFNKLFGNHDDKVVLTAFGIEYQFSRSIAKSTAKLVEDISPERKVGNHYLGGILDSHLHSADERIQEALNKKAQKTLEKEAKLAAKRDAATKLQDDATKLKNSIDELLKGE